jgi:hypothetical protein
MEEIVSSSKIFLQVFLHMEIILEEIMDEILQIFLPYGGNIGGKLGGNGAVGWAACGRRASISSHVDTRALCENRKVSGRNSKFLEEKDWTWRGKLDLVCDGPGVYVGAVSGFTM